MARAQPQQLVVTPELRDLIETRLDALRLGEQQILEQSVEDLEDSLDRLNTLIQSPGSLGVKSVVGVKLWVIEVDTESVLNFTVLQVLLNRKSLVISRLRQLRQVVHIGDIRRAIEFHVSDPSTRSSLLAAVDESESDQIKESARLVEEEAALQRMERTQELRVKVFERRTAVYRTFLERESIASIVGATLLLGLAASLVIAMFAGTTVSDVITNSFLLILGYFFGQGVVRTSRREPE